MQVNCPNCGGIHHTIDVDFGGVTHNMVPCPEMPLNKVAIIKNTLPSRAISLLADIFKGGCLRGCKFAQHVRDDSAVCCMYLQKKLMINIEEFRHKDCPWFRIEQSKD